MKVVSWDEEYDDLGFNAEAVTRPSRRRRVSGSKKPEPVHVSALGNNGLLAKTLKTYELTVRTEFEGSCPHKHVSLLVGKLPVFGSHVEFEKLLAKQKSE